MSIMPKTTQTTRQVFMCFAIEKKHRSICGQKVVVLLSSIKWNHLGLKFYEKQNIPGI